MKKTVYKKAFVTVEAAAVLGLYLTIMGALIGWGLQLYKDGTKTLEQSVEMKSVKDICEQKRQLECLEEIRKD